MATFNPYDKAIKESINVDFRDRHSAQRVILCNRGNIFYGEFIGVLSANDATINKGMINNVTLSNAIILNPDGTELHLSDVTDKVGNFESKLEDFELRLIPDLSDNISTLCEAINNTSCSLYNLSGNLEVEKDQRFSDDNKLSVEMYGISSELYSSITNISSDFDKHVRQQTADLSAMNQNLLNEIELRKRYDIIDINPSIGQENGLVYRVKDYSSNYIDAVVPYTQFKDLKSRYVGYATNVGKDGNKISSFTFNSPDRTLVPALAKDQYNFTEDKTKLSTGYHGYELWWDVDNSNNELKTILTATDNAPFLSVCMTETDEPIGKIYNFLPDALDVSVPVVSAGLLMFDSELPQNLSGFERKEFEFSKTQRITSFIDDGITRIISVDFTTQQFVIRDNYTAVYYQSLSDETVEYGRIYEDEVEYYPNSTAIKQLSVEWENGNGFETYELVVNGQAKEADISKSQYLTYSNYQVCHVNKARYYGSEFKKYNIQTHASEGAVIGRITIDEKNTPTIDTSVVSSLTLKILFSDGPFDAGEYVLNKKTVTEEPLKVVYECIDTITDNARLILTFDPQTSNFIKYVIESDSVTIGYLKLELDPSEFVVLVDESVCDTTITLKVDKNGKLSMPIEDPKGTKTYVLNHKNEIDYDAPKYYNVFTSTEASSSLFIEIPEAFEENKAREFAVVLNKHVNDRDIILKFQYDTTRNYKFFVNGTDVSNGLVIHEDKTILKFLEIRDGIFTIDVISNTDYVNVISISALTGDIDVLRVSKTAEISTETVVNSKISTLVATDLTGATVSAFNLTSDNVNISTENVLSSTIEKLTAINLSSVNVSAHVLTADQISVGLENITLINGTEISSAAQISSNFQSQINDIADNVEQLSGIDNTLKVRINNTIVDAISSVNESAVPEYLMLRDVDDRRNLYVLQVKSGRLVINLVDFTPTEG